MSKLLLIDGNSILNRAYYGIRMLNAPDGTPTNAVYGFLNILFKNIEEETPDYLCVAFDVKEKTFRHKLYDRYKAQRKPAPEDFLVQLPLIKEVLSDMGIVCLESPGYEADDIIGTVSGVCESEGIECIILTGDKDDLQLASENTKIKLVVTRLGTTSVTVYNSDAVMEKYSVTPKEFIEVKGLMGDPSDNIPGVKGIGEKTAFSLIEKYKSIDNIYENLDGIEASPSVKNKLLSGKESAYLSRTLATIDRKIPIDVEIRNLRQGEGNSEKLAEFFIRLNFKSFMAKLDVKAVPKKEAEIFEGSCKTVSSDEFFEKICSGAVAAYRLIKEPSGNFGIATAANGGFLMLSGAEMSDIKRFFENEEIKKLAFGAKEDILALKEMGCEMCGLAFDAEIAAYILEPSSSDYNLEHLAAQYLNLEIGKRKNEEENGQLTFDFSDDESGSDLAQTAAELYAICGLYEKLGEELEQNGQHKLYYEVELPLIEVLADMQHTGVLVDKAALNAFGEELSAGISGLETNIYGYAGRSFNINSPKQLGEILFDVLSLPHGKKTKTGYSTNADVLKKLMGVHPIVADILDYRALMKLKSTYVDGLMGVISSDGRIHSSFNQTVTATGRISSTEPNLQNIPVRTKRGREMRKMFVAPSGKLLLDADYSQIELRVLAHLSGDENMQSAFGEGQDIHTKTAAQVFKVPIEEVSQKMRSSAKAVNFGIVYGIGEFSLSQDLGISIGEAKRYISDYLGTYPKIKQFMEESVANARSRGYALTILNRRRYIPELKASNKITQAFGERVAMNAPVQGSAADIIKIAMVGVYKRLKAEKLNSKLILQVHDELIVEAEPSEKTATEKILREEMENAVSLSVPLAVDMNSGKTWYETK